MKRKMLFVVSMLLVLSMLLTACGTKATETVAPTQATVAEIAAWNRL
jgi:ABC-type Fe3+-citrate transport system substrate-binding protein